MKSPLEKIINRGGFSIIEVIFSVGLISVSFVALMSLFAYNIRMEINSRDKIIASYLAQEAVEVVRCKRDNNWFKGMDWLDGIPTSASDKVLDIIDPNNLYNGWEIKNSSSDNSKKIYINSNGDYIQSLSFDSAWKETVFERYLEIEKLSGVEAIKITVYVQYGSGEVRLVSYLYDGWY